DPDPVPEPVPRPLPPWPWPFPPLPRPFPWPLPLPWPWFCRFFSRNWWMYHHDERHSGHASGCSSITSTNVGTMTLHRTVALDGPVITIPSVVQGKIYVGTGNRPGGGGTLYKIDLLSGTIDLHYDTPAGAGYYPGIGGSPAVVAGKVYFTALPGMVYCLD